MRIDRTYNRRIPSIKEFENFIPRKNATLWDALGDEWRCPVCGRSKFEILRWKKHSGVDEPLFGEGRWTCSLHEHHDHGKRWSGRFVLCGDCNAADGAAKRALRLPSDWSFSPEELRMFVRCEPNGSIESVDLSCALEIFAEESEKEWFISSPGDREFLEDVNLDFSDE